MSGERPHLELKGVGKRYGDVTALERVDLRVDRGEFVTLLGPSGSGKTTTLMIIAGFEKASTGTVEVEGRSISDLPPDARNIGIVFQNYALFPHKNSLKNVYFPLQMRGVSRRAGEKRAAEMLELVGLKGFGERFPKELSGGQQQRVALARALVFEPSLLLLDEPLGALDKNLREQMQIEIKRIQRTLGVTTLFVTHDQSEAMSMSDRIVVFDKGTVQQAATPVDIYRRPATRFVASFIGESNLLDAMIGASGNVEHAALGSLGINGGGAGRPSGTRATVLIRPEDIDIVASPIEGRGNARMKVSGVVNYGDNALVVGSAEGVPFRVRLHRADVGNIREGDVCTISWKAEDVYVIGEGPC